MAKPTLRELRHRRVPQVAGFYLAAGWVALEVADTAFPRLGLPDWSVTLVLALLILGFPLAVGLSWIYDFNADGISRTAPSADATARPPGGDPAPAAPAPARATAGRIAVVGAVLVLALAGGAFVIWGGGSESELDAELVAVLPFRIAAPPELAVLREGMVDLLATKLTGDGGPRAVDSRTALNRYSAAAGGGELSLEEALEVARELGAGRLLLGEVVVTGSEVTLSAALYDAARAGRSAGSGPTRTTVSGPVDSLTALVDRMAARLLSVAAGEGSHRLATLTTTSLPALRSYLAGQAAYRRGRFAEAVERFGEAVDEDSTFALAAMGMGVASDWTGHGDLYDRGLRLAWEHRDRLSDRDRALLVARAGPRYPDRSSGRELIAASERAARLAPGEPEFQYTMGDLYFHQGELAGYPDAQDRAWRAFGAALELDSTFGPALSHYQLLAVIRRDTAAFNRARRLRHVTEPEPWPEEAWLEAVAAGDDEARRRTRPALDSMRYSSLIFLVEAAALGGLPLDDLRDAMDAFVARTGPGPERRRVIQYRMLLEMSAGRFRELPALAREYSSPQSWFGGLIQAWSELFFDGDTEFAHEGLRTMADRADPAIGGAPLSAGNRANTRCFIAYDRMRHGDTVGVRVVADELLTGHDLACAYLLRAELAVRSGAPGALVEVQRLDSLMLHSPDVAIHFRSAADVVIARLYEALGQPEAALHAVRRADGIPGFGALAPGWRLRARLARDLGHSDEAVTYYRKYLELRDAPDPGSAAAAEVAVVRRELAALLGDG